MNKLDKTIRALLGWIGTIFDVCTFIIKYILGLVWSLYMLIRGEKLKAFHYLNEHSVNELKWIIDEFKHYLED